MCQFASACSLVWMFIHSPSTSLRISVHLLLSTYTSAIGCSFVDLGCSNGYDPSNVPIQQGISFASLASV